MTEQIDTDNWWGRLVLYVLGALAEMYIWQSSARTREAKLERVMRGFSNGTFRFGYCNGLCSTCTDPNGEGYCPRYGLADRAESQRGRIPVPHPVEMHAVKLAASLYGQHKSDLDIANLLNSHQYQLPDGTVVSFRTKGLRGKANLDILGKIISAKSSVIRFMSGMLPIIQPGLSIWRMTRKTFAAERRRQ